MSVTTYHLTWHNIQEDFGLFVVIFLLLSFHELGLLVSSDLGLILHHYIL